MAIAAALVGAKGNGTTSATTTSGTTATSGSTFVIAASFDASYSSITTKGDNKGNTYTALGTVQTDGSGGATQLFVCENGAGGSGHAATFTVSGAGYISLFLIEITGAETASLDQNAQAYDTSSPFTATSGTLAQADELVLCICASNSSGSTPTYASSNCTILGQETDTTSWWTSAVGYFIVSATTAVTPSWTRSGFVQAAVALATFKQASGGGGGATRGMSFGPGTAFNGGRTFKGIIC